MSISQAIPNIQSFSGRLANPVSGQRTVGPLGGLSSPIEPIDTCQEMVGHRPDRSVLRLSDAGTITGSQPILSRIDLPGGPTLFVWCIPCDFPPPRKPCPKIPFPAQIDIRHRKSANRAFGDLTSVHHHFKSLRSSPSTDNEFHRLPLPIQG